MRAYVLTGADCSAYAGESRHRLEPGAIVTASPVLDKDLDRYWVGRDPDAALFRLQRQRKLVKKPWPLHLFEVDVLVPRAHFRHYLLNNASGEEPAESFEVLAEIPADQLCGPYGAQVFRFAQRLRDLDAEGWFRVSVAAIGSPRAEDAAAWARQLNETRTASPKHDGEDLLRREAAAGVVVGSYAFPQLPDTARGLSTKPAGWPTRRIEAVLAARALAAPEAIEAELFEEILEPFVRVMGEDWFTSPSQVPPLPWPHGPVMEHPSSFPENGLAP